MTTSSLEPHHRMDRSTTHYPNLRQASGLVLICIALGFAVGVPLELLALLLPEPLRSHALFRSALEMVVYGLTLGLAIRVGLRKKSLALVERPALKFTRVPVSILVMVCALTICMGFIIDPITALIPTPEWFEQMMGEALRPNLFSFVSVVLLAPLLEELLFRGIILDGLLKNHSPAKAIAGSAVLFGVIHLNIWQGIAGLLAGLFLGWVYWKTRSLVPCILIHATHNLLAFVVTMYAGVEATGAEVLGMTSRLALFAGALGLFTVGVWWLSRRMRTSAEARVVRDPTEGVLG
ncbi:CPBP family intramembrane metalloprotease [Archangium gephyra]|uniref:CPBP family intramembrane glutamic endopeptidase n=1 Tax=Archangium gephyra TaxID=48 RepID=UPI0035D4F60D